MYDAIMMTVLLAHSSAIQAGGHLLLIDFGLSIYFKDAWGEHAALNVTPNLFSGTPIYASLWSHQGMSSSRRNDLESLGYTILHLCLDGGLPWANLPHASKKLLKIRAEIHECKKVNSIASMCSKLPLPVARAICVYFNSVRALGFDERPDCALLQFPTLINKHLCKLTIVPQMLL
jgi:serine/threonine protein kinase